MLSGMLEQLLGAYSALLFLVILAGHHSCSATNNCAPSSCGNITHISYPFRLQTDPISCGRKEYELGCENNRATLYLHRVKYYVQAIDYYPRFTIRLVEADFQKDDCLSIPRHSSYTFDYEYYYPFRYAYSSFTLTLISCPSPIPSPPFNFVNTSSCKNGSFYSPTFRHMEGYSYLMVGDVKIVEVPDLCRIDWMYHSSYFQLENITNMSSIEVQDLLAYINFSSFTLNFISCSKPIPSPPFHFVNTSSCKNGSIYSYVMVDDDVKVAEVPDLCRIDLMYEPPSIFQQLVNITNMSLSLIEVHDILAYGFELSWEQAACDYAEKNHLNLDNYYCTPRNNAPIRAAIAFLANRILAYLAFLANRILAYLATWRLKRYFPDGRWIQYDSFAELLFLVKLKGAE